MKSYYVFLAFVLSLAPVGAFACQHESASTFRTQDKEFKREAVMTVASRLIEVHSLTGEKASLWQKKLPAGKVCKTSTFGNIQLLDQGETILMVCNNYDVEELSDVAVVLVREGNVVAIEAGDLVSSLVRDHECDQKENVDQIHQYQWMSYIHDITSSEVIIVTAEKQVRRISLKNGTLL